MIEPLPYNFAALQKNCGKNPNIRLLQAAVDVARGRRPVYDLAPELRNLPDWTRGLASFSLGRLQEAVTELRLQGDVIRSIEVDTIPWSDVRNEFGSSEPDVLSIDTEGYDIALLRMFDLAQHRPRIVHFEHACVQFEERMIFYSEILRLGYEVASEAGDTTAWLPT
jgi:FkbM family methyltransferase